jgi:hypothetical protein
MANPRLGAVLAQDSTEAAFDAGDQFRKSSGPEMPRSLQSQVRRTLAGEVGDE